MCLRSHDRSVGQLRPARELRGVIEHSGLSFERSKVFKHPQRFSNTYSHLKVVFKCLPTVANCSNAALCAELEEQSGLARCAELSGKRRFVFSYTEKMRALGVWN